MLRISRFFVILFILMVLGCGSGSGNKVIDPNNEDTKTITISSINGEIIIDENVPIILLISGTNNDITIKENNTISLTISGIHNNLTFENNVIVQTFIISGIDNEIYIPLDSGITFEGSGTGNVLIEY